LWRAQRDGVRAEQIDEAGGAAMPFAAGLDAALALVAEDAEALGCAGEVAAARGIVNADTSADRQLAAFEGARARPERARGARRRRGLARAGDRGRQCILTRP
jgi:carboxylate-amine ligase